MARVLLTRREAAERPVVGPEMERDREEREPWKGLWETWQEGWGVYKAFGGVSYGGIPGGRCSGFYGEGGF